MWEPDNNMVIYQGSNLILKLFEVYTALRVSS